jgi:hypothetical protein
MVINPSLQTKISRDRRDCGVGSATFALIITGQNNPFV